MSRIGFYFRSSDSKYIQRWRCKACKKTVSSATGTACFGQNKRRVNEPLRKLLGMNFTQRAAARFLKINKTTVARKQNFLSIQCLNRQRKYLRNKYKKSLLEVQFDEMESFEHSKMKPLSIALAVCAQTREILDLQVRVMPAKGRLAKKSRAKYGKRADDRADGMKELFANIDEYVAEKAIFTSDKNPKYPRWLRRHSKDWLHKTVKGQRGCIVGQGELKKTRFDPIFSLNHTCAMIRANVSRLIRKTWVTTKKMHCLQEHLYIYMDNHNQKIAENLFKKSTSPLPT